MPRDIEKELVELTQGIHQFTMMMFTLLEKVIDDKDAREQVIRVLENEINYLRGEEHPDPKGAINRTIEYLQTKRDQVMSRASDADEYERYRIAEESDKILDIIEYLKESL